MIVDRLGVGVAGGDALAQQHAQIVRQIGVGIVDQFVLADETAQLLADRARPRLERRVGQQLARLDRCAAPAAASSRQERQRARRGFRCGQSCCEQRLSSVFDARRR